MEVKTDLEKNVETQKKDARLEAYLKNYNGPIYVDEDEAAAEAKKNENKEE